MPYKMNSKRSKSKSVVSEHSITSEPNLTTTAIASTSAIDPQSLKLSSFGNEYHNNDDRNEEDSHLDSAGDTDYDLWESSDSPFESWSDCENNNSDGEWPVEKIVSEEVNLSGNVSYEIKWKNWCRPDGTSTTWERELEGQNNLIRTWDKCQRKLREKLAGKSITVDLTKMAQIDAHDIRTWEWREAVWEKYGRALEEKKRRKGKKLDWGEEVDSHKSTIREQVERTKVERELLLKKSRGGRGSDIAMAYSRARRGRVRAMRLERVERLSEAQDNLASALDLAVQQSDLYDKENWRGMDVDVKEEDREHVGISPNSFGRGQGNEVTSSANVLSVGDIDKIWDDDILPMSESRRDDIISSEGSEMEFITSRDTGVTKRDTSPTEKESTISPSNFSIPSTESQLKINAHHTSFTWKSEPDIKESISASNADPPFHQLRRTRSKLESQWNECITEAKAKPVYIMNGLVDGEDDRDGEDFPPVSEDFRYLENGYLFAEGIEKPSHEFLVGCTSLHSCVNPKDCECQESSNVIDENGYKLIAYDRNGLFLFNNEGSEVIECNSRCQCISSTCFNRVSQLPRDITIEIFKTHKVGWGARATEKVKRGKVLGLYTGEILRREDADMIPLLDKHYIFNLDTRDQDGDDVCFYSVNAEFAGNWTRFINHSCDPVAAVYPVVIDTPLEMNMPYLAIVAKTDILARTEITIDYSPMEPPGIAGYINGNNGKGWVRAIIPDGRQKCYCGTSICRGYM